MRNINDMDFLKSSLQKEGKYISNDDFLKWYHERQKAVAVKIEKIKFSELINWEIKGNPQKIAHASGKFFSIDGIDVNTNWGLVNNWSQPIINQPEIGFLGIIAKPIDGVLHFLMQAKIEPGNINYVQISPTLQATKSNYTQVHKGNPPAYLNYFRNRGSNTEVLLDQLQSEQGARFLKKRNRNIIIKVNEEIKVEENFCWLTLGQIQHFLNYDNMINMDTRTVISGISFGSFSSQSLDLYDTITPLFNPNSDYEVGMLFSAIEKDKHLYSMEELISWFTELKSKYEIEVNQIGIDKLKHWEITDSEIKHEQNKYFKVIAVNVEIGNREVTSWTQPIIESMQEGIIAFIVKKINGVYHFLVQAKLEAGNLDVLELAPTVQCLTGNYRKGESEYDVPFLDFVMENMGNESMVKHNTFQSEEGGRFYKEQNKSIIIEATEDFESIPENYTWMTLNQIKTFIKYNNYLNIQSRSLISTINFI